MSLKTPTNETDADAEKVLGFDVNISHIVTNGCSFTFCQGLPNIKEQGWPGLISKNLNCPLVNLGLPGVGNDSITRRSVEYLLNNISLKGGKPLVIIGWSQPWRREAWLQYKNKKYYEYQEYYTIAYPLNPKEIDNGYQQGLLDHWNEEDHYRRSLMSKISLISFLENYDIPFIMTDFMNQEENKEVSKMVDEKFFGISSVVKNNKFLIEPMHELTSQMAKLPCGHDGVETQVFIANFILSKIKMLHPELTFTNNEDYYSLSEFSNISNLYKKFPEWCNFKLNCDNIV